MNKCNIDNLTLGEIKEIAKLVNGSPSAAVAPTLNGMLGKKVIVRTYSAGVHYGELYEKSGNEVILKDARRMWSWHAKESISLSGVAVYGIRQDKSNIAPKVEYHWLEAIEIIPVTDTAAKTIEGAKDAEAS